MPTITNGYCTIAELRNHALNAASYASATISFDATTKQIRDSAGGLKRFISGQRLQVSGSTSNDGYYTVASGGTTSPVTVNESVINEAASKTITIADVSDPTDDDAMVLAINAASRQIDAYCRRRFWVNTVDETRYYDTEFEDLVYTDDIQSVTSIALDIDGSGAYTTTMAATDYVLSPRNAMYADMPAYTRIMRAPLGNYYFPTKRRPYYGAGGYRYYESQIPTEYGAVRITGKFGVPCPEDVHRACLIWAFHLFKRKDSPMGVLGMTEYGAVRVQGGIDPDVAQLLDNNVRMFTV